MKVKFVAALVAAATLAPVVAGPVSISQGKQATQKAPVEVRLVNWEGEILADRSVEAQTTSVPTSSRATCFGGTPTNGTRILEGTTALGALQRATSGISGLRPLLLTNAFDFGIGVCAVGRYAPEGEEWWALRVNGALATTGGDSTFLESGDRVLWYLDRSYNAPMPDELRLVAPAVAGKGSQATVRVIAYDVAGRSRPAAGVRVFVGASLAGTTDRSGRIKVRIDSATRLVARLAGFIPSNRVAVDVRAPRRQKAARQASRARP